MSTVNKDSFIFSFQSMPFYLPYCTDSASSEILNTSGDNGHHCLIPDFKEKAFGLSPLNPLAVGFWGGMNF